MLAFIEENEPAARQHNEDVSRTKSDSQYTHVHIINIHVKKKKRNQTNASPCSVASAAAVTVYFSHEPLMTFPATASVFLLSVLCHRARGARTDGS